MQGVRKVTVHFSKPVPHCNAVRNLVDKFRETGSVDDAKRCGRSAKLSGVKLLDIFDNILQSPSKSLRKLALQDDIDLATAHKGRQKPIKALPIQNNGSTRTENH